MEPFQDHTGNNNAYGCLEPSEQHYRETNTFAGGDYTRSMTPLERSAKVHLTHH